MFTRKSSPNGLPYEYPRNEQPIDVVTGSRFVLVICAIYVSHMDHSGNVSSHHDEKQGHQQPLVDGRRQHSSEKNITYHIDKTHVHNGMKYDENQGGSSALALVSYT